MKNQLKRALSLKIRGQMVSLFSIAALLLIAAAAFSFWQFSGSLRVYDEDVMSAQKNAIDAQTAEINFKKQVQEWKDTLLRGKNPEAFDKYWSAFQQRESEVRKMADGLSHSIADPEAAQLVAKFVAAHSKMGDSYRRGLQEFKVHDFDSAIGDKAVAGMDREPTELLTKATERLLSLGESRATDAREGARQTVKLAALLFSIAVAFSVAVFLIVVQMIISRPLTKVVGALGELANGNFSIVLPGLARGDEIGEIARAVEGFKVKAEEKARDEAEAKVAQDRIAAEQRTADMHGLADSFEAAVGEIIETVSSAATELEASATSLTRTVEQTQRLSTTVASASEEATTNVQSVAFASEEMASSVNEISRQVQEAARIANEAVATAHRADERINSLSQASAKIGDVVDLISMIAGQTNLLALNATIEAARAGEAGRGFAVVASEVKALAEQTAKATAEIGQHITSIQSATQESVAEMKEIGGVISKLSEISATIASAVEEQGAATQEIARNVQQAAAGTAQVASNITEVNSGAAETGGASSQVLAAAKSLAGDTDRLKLEVGKFLGTVRAA